VKLRRERNENKLRELGLWSFSNDVQALVQSERAQKAAKRVMDNKRKRDLADQEPKLIRRSSRVKGELAPNSFVDSEVGGKFILGGSELPDASGGSSYSNPPLPKHYDGRINDGSPVSIFDGYELDKENVDDAEKQAIEEERRDITSLMEALRTTTSSPSRPNPSRPKKAASSSPSSSSLMSTFSRLSIDSEAYTAKVTPDRIYSMAVAPLNHKVLVAAGDKKGFIGLWDCTPDADDAVVCNFKPHAHSRGGQVGNLQFLNNTNDLLSVSYDGTVRLLDVEHETFKCIFSGYDSNNDTASSFSSSPGYGTLDSRAWFQFGVASSPTDLYLTTSSGGVLRYDMRSNTLPLNVTLSEKKINTVCVSPTDPNTIVTAGLENCVCLWDVRKLGGQKKSSKPVDRIDFKRSVTSAYFNNTGDKLLTTNMNDTLSVIPMLKAGFAPPSAHTNIRHDNQTGRWLTTFHAIWHPKTDMIAVGSMKQPRGVDLFDATGKSPEQRVTGDVITAVPTRLAFHESGDILVGGNASGRVVVMDNR
jgi:WD40 repeat protein